MKITPAMSTILHIIWSGVFGLIVGGGAAVVQYNSVHGIDVGVDVSLFAGMFLTGFGSMAIATWHNIEKSPALPQAEKDVEAQAVVAVEPLAQQAHERLDQVVKWINSHATQHSTAPVQPVVAKPQQNTTPVSAPTPQVVPTNAPPANAQLLTTLPNISAVQVTI